MQNTIKNNVIKAAAMTLLFLSLQACSPLPGKSELDVAGAYSSSDTVVVSPYTRTIFSSNNF